MSEILANAPIEAWFGLFGVLIGATLSIFGVWLSNRSNISQLKLQLEHEKISNRSNTKRERLEELHVLVSHWLNGLFYNYINFTLVLKGEIDYNQYHDKIIEYGKEKPADFQRLEMIIDIYAPELRSTYEKVTNARTKLNSISARHWKGYDLGEFEGTKYLESYNQASLEIDKYGEQLKCEIAECARNA